MLTIRYVQPEDKEFWFRIDRFMPEQEFDHKVRSGRGYVLLLDNTPIGLMRYNLFWDHIPFCNLLFLEDAYRRKGYGRQLMERWEAAMKAQGYHRVMTSTQADEGAQHFYRKLGYRDCGGFVLETQDPMELILTKVLK